MCNGGNLAQSFLRLSPPNSGMDPSILAQSSHFSSFHLSLLLLPFDLKARPLLHTHPNEKQEVPYQNIAIAFVLQLLVEQEHDDHPQERFDEEDDNDSMIDGWMIDGWMIDGWMSHTHSLTHSLCCESRASCCSLTRQETKEATEATDRFDNNTIATTPHKNTLLPHASS
jgi:hypothetical protein